MSRNCVSLNVHRAIGWLYVIAAILLCSGLLIESLKLHWMTERVFGIGNMFNVDEEDNIPTLFSALNMLIAAMLLFLQARLESVAKNRPYWLGLGMIFVYLSLDEVLSLHERLGPPLRATLGIHDGFFYFAWLLVVLPLVALLGLIYLRFLLRLPHGLALGLVAAGVVFIGGAAGMEMLGGWYYSRHGVHNMIYICVATLEEGLEMYGVVLLIRALLRYMAPKGIIRIDFGMPLTQAETAAGCRLLPVSVAGLAARRVCQRRDALGRQP